MWLWVGLADQQSHLAGAAAGRQANADPLRTDGVQLTDRAFHHHRVREVYEMYGHRAVLLPDCKIHHTRPGNAHHVRLVQRPAYHVGQEAPVVRIEHFPERAVDVAREIRDAAAVVRWAL